MVQNGDIPIRPQNDVPRSATRKQNGSFRGPRPSGLACCALRYVGGGSLVIKVVRVKLLQ